ncbi:MAG: class I SAM-dependent methyltransferase [Opitutaceae bacterium]
MTISEETRRILALAPDDCLMTAAEKAVLVGLLHQLRPSSVLEFGFRNGGSCRFFADVAREVVTVDLDPTCAARAAQWSHVRFLAMRTTEAVRLLKNEGKHFDFMLVDADHARASTRADVEAALELADIVLVHDSFNPCVRAGVKDALRGQDIYCDLDFVPGCLQSNGLWGGFALIVPSLKKNERYNFDPRVSAQPGLAGMAFFRNPVSTYADTWWGRFITRGKGWVRRKISKA